MATPEKYSHINFKPPNGVRREAEYGLKLRREYGRGGTAVGIARARDLSNGVAVSPSTVRRMKAFFDRHQSDESAPGFSRGDKEWPSNGLIANKLWGGSSGYSWAKKLVNQMNAADEKEGRSLRPFGSTQGLKPKIVVVHGPPCSGKAEYVAAHIGEGDVVFDFDSVMSAISGRPRYQPSETLISYCLDIRTLILKKAMRGSTKAWVTVTRVTDEMRSQLSDVPVEYVRMDASKEECLQRLEEDSARSQIAEELRKVIEEYFSEGEERRAVPTPGVERRFVGNFGSAERLDPELLRIEKRSDPETGKPRTYIVGYAARFHRDSLLMGDFIEQIDPEAFEIVKNRQDEDGKPLETRCLFNHDPNHLLGRFPTTMRMTVDEKGLKYECLLPESRTDLEELIARGDLKGSSFSFVVSPDGGEQWSYENGQSRRIVKKIKAVLDCGPVTYPAYGDASVAVAKRSYEAFCEQRDCGRGEGGKFGSGNKCQKDGEGGGDVKEKAKKALDDYEAKRKGGDDDDEMFHGAEVGSDFNIATLAATAIGSALGALGGTAGVFAGGAVGAFIGSKVDSARYRAKFDKAAKEMGVSQKSLDSFAKGVGAELALSYGKNGEIVGDTGINGMTMSIQKYDKSEVGPRLAGKMAFIKNPHDILGEKKGTESIGRLAQTMAREGKKLGVNHVAVALDASDKLSVKAFGRAGFDTSIKSDDGKQVTVFKSYKKSPSRRSYSDLVAFLAERRDNECGRDEGGRFGSGNECQKDGTGGKPKSKYMELNPPLSPGETDEAQEFVDDAREGQLSAGGKDGGKADDGSGVQTWSKGDTYPWTVKQVGTDKGYVQGTHPDGSKTEKYPFENGDTKEADRLLRDELKKKNEKRVSKVIEDTLKFLRERSQ
jgi:HK97 family phage prohead protease